jgi:hypothetical protein
VSLLQVSCRSSQNDHWFKGKIAGSYHSWRFLSQVSHRFFLFTHLQAEPKSQPKGPALPIGPEHSLGWWRYWCAVDIAKERGKKTSVKVDNIWWKYDKIW